MMTLFKCLTNGIDWDELTDPLGNIGIFWVGLLMLFIAFGIFVFLNVVTGVFCQTAMDAAAHDHEMLIQSQVANKTMYIKRIKQLFRKLDDNDSGVITVTEMEKAMADQEVADYFKSLDIDTEDAWTLFKLLDTDETNAIDLEEFVLGCLRLKGTARSIDIAKLMHEHQWMAKRFVEFTSAWEESLQDQDSHADSAPPPWQGG
jgi:Ca2+-binding EF-hand superfamily protein